MKSIAEQFFAAGLISHEHYGALQLVEQRRSTLSEDSTLADSVDFGNPCVQRLIGCRSMRQFTYAAETILQDDPSQIGIIYRCAFRFSSKASSHQFLWRFYRLWRILPKLHPAEQLDFIDDVFVRRGVVAILHRIGMLFDAERTPQPPSNA